MRWFIIINPPQYRDNDDDQAGFAWAGEAQDEADAFEQACADCEASNDWEPGEIDRDETHIIEAGPDYRHMVEEARKVLATVSSNSEPDAMGAALDALVALLAREA